MKISQGIALMALALAPEAALGKKDGSEYNFQNNNLRSVARKLQTCPNQEPCHDFGRGLMGYSVSKINENDRSCEGYCAAGQNLEKRLADGYECGACEAPYCPGVQSCGMVGDNNDLPGFPVSRTTDGLCEQFCAGGGALVNRLQQGFSCGPCDTAVCQNQPSCYDFGDGLLGYDVYRLTSNRSCEQFCAAGSALNKRISQGYTCGQCPNPQCQNDQPCDTFNGVPAYHVFRGTGKDCLQYCASGDDLINRLNDGFTCGVCPDIGIPNTCENPVECGLINGNMGYSIYRMRNDGGCDGRCATGVTLFDRLGQGWTCGECPPVTCPGVTSCGQFDGGVPGYPIYKFMEDGFCQGYCAAGQTLLDRQNLDGFTCGVCPPANGGGGWASCPNADPCDMFGETPGYAVHRMTNNGMNCNGFCAAGTALLDRLDDGFVCGECPPPPSCPGQTPCGDFDGVPGFNIFRGFPASGNLPAYCSGYCAGGTNLDQRLREGYQCGTCQ